MLVLVQVLVKYNDVVTLLLHDPRNSFIQAYTNMIHMYTIYSMHNLNVHTYYIHIKIQFIMIQAYSLHYTHSFLHTLHTYIKNRLISLNIHYSLIHPYNTLIQLFDMALGCYECSLIMTNHYISFRPSVEYMQENIDALVDVPSAEDIILIYYICERMNWK